MSEKSAVTGHASRVSDSAIPIPDSRYPLTCIFVRTMTHDPRSSHAMTNLPTPPGTRNTATVEHAPDELDCQVLELAKFSSSPERYARNLGLPETRVGGSTGAAAGGALRLR
jgi:hypothetical protein